MHRVPTITGHADTRRGYVDPGVHDLDLTRRTRGNRCRATVLTTRATIRTGSAPDPGTGSSAAGAAPAGGWGPATLTAVPDPPRPAALPADFATARSVAAAYLAAWCYQPAGQPANTNLRNAAGWMTAAGWADDSSRAVDEPSWALTQAAGVSAVCGPAIAGVSPQGPNSSTAVWVTVTAQQARVRGGALIGQSPVSMMRRVLQAPDGRWLVDVRVMAG